MEPRKPLKHNSSCIGSVRQKKRNEIQDIQRQQRDKVLQSKRVRQLTVEELEEEVSIIQVKELAKSIQLNSSDRISILRILRRAFGQGSEYVDDFLRVDGASKSLIGLLTGTDVDQQLEAAWCVTNIAASNHEHSILMLKMAAPYLIMYLTSSNPIMQDQSAWALGNIAGDEEECRLTLKAQGIIAPLINLLKSPVDSVVKSASFALCNMARGGSNSTRDIIGANVASSLQNLLVYNKTEKSVLCEVSWLLTYLTANDEHVQELVQVGILDKISQLLVDLDLNEPNDFQVVTPLLRSLGNICSGADAHSAQACSNESLLPALKVFLTSQHHHIRKECLWALSNMTCEINVARGILTHSLVKPILQLLDSSTDIQKEACFCMCNLLFHSTESTEELMAQGCIEAMSPLINHIDPEIVKLVFCFLEMALRLSDRARETFEIIGSIKQLENLRFHHQEIIRTQASDLMDLFSQMEIGVENDTKDSPTHQPLYIGVG